MIYRPEIDGLRAIAVLSVVIFHFFPNILPNGYLGVDIFFVISGYLITNRLIKLNKKHYKKALGEFYVLRIKRLFPAFFVFLLITTLIIPFVFLKSDFEKYSSSLIAAKTFWANWYFWQDGGYFGGRNDLKPLLHVWSLSVEEQFYIIYPTLIITFFWFSKKINLKVIIQITIITFLSFIIWVYMQNIGGSNPAFFLLPTRIWQFGLGALLVFTKNYYFLENKWSRNLNSLILLLIIFIGINLNLLGFNNNQLQTIIVTLATAFFLYIKKNKKDKFVILFANNFSIWFGKISYSIYLYHWPIAVLILYYFIDQSSIPIVVSFAGITLSIFLGFLSFKFIELPFRYLFSFKHSLMLILVCTLLSLIVVKFVENFQKKTLADYLAEANGDHFRCNYNSYIFYEYFRGCILNKNKNTNKTVALLGNSHAQMYGSLFAKKLKESKINGVLYSYENCLPTVSVNINKNCFKKSREALELLINNKKIQYIFISMNWNHDRYVDSLDNTVTSENFLNALFELTDILKKHNKSVFVLSPISTPNRELSNELPRMLKFKKIKQDELNEYISFDRIKFDKKFGKINRKLKEKYGFNLIPVYEDLCDSNYCYYGKKNILFYADSQHLSQSGSHFLTKTDNKLSYIFQQYSLEK